MKSKKRVNRHEETIKDFGLEWEFYSQDALSKHDAEMYFNAYFKIFPWSKLSADSVGADVGCGSGRWAIFVAPRVGKLLCIDPSQAIDVAKVNLDKFDNCEFIRSSIDSSGVPAKSLDFAYSLGVLHHIPDTLEALKDCVHLLKKGAPFLLYLYYDFDNKPSWYRTLWKFSDLLRLLVSRLPFKLKLFVTQLLALVIYYPFARLAFLLGSFGLNVDNFPLSSYRAASFYVMRTDALDRFGTRLEHRFSKAEITKMMELAGLENIVFSDESPFWCSLGFAK